ncbi:MAG: RNase adapter RapZ [Actinomycetota bacterium]|nr:RNase adapter RapZ [Actinomycetota bacterium]
MTDTSPQSPAEETPHPSGPELVVITGMSGAGRSEAIHTFEDIGFFCIDNLPPSFFGQLVNLTALPGSRIRRIAVVCDLRAKSFFDELAGELGRLEEGGVPFHLLFLEADDDVLVRRFSETRRRHPLCEDEGGSVADAIRAERAALAEVRLRADLIIDTSDLAPRDLRRQIKDRLFLENLAPSLAVTVSSFGFKYGVPIDADIVMDVRFLPNPYYDPELRRLTGLDDPVREFVLGRDETAEFTAKWFDLLSTLAPGYVMEGKTHLSVALGCTGGMHRSVALAEETAAFLGGLGFRVATSHRDIGRDRERR